MKTIVYHNYGSPDVLQLEEGQKPAPGKDEVLIKVRAASVNPYDWHFMRGLPYPLRIAFGLRKPRDARLGVDVAGQVEVVGREVTQFKPGDEVFGAARGAFAEFACGAESKLALKPKNVTFEQAAVVPIAGLTALQGLRRGGLGHKGQVQPAPKVLINGAGGGVGTFAVQIAKAFDVEVTGVCSAAKVEMVRALGADHVIDYTKDNFTKSGQRYDLIFDCVANHSLSAFRRVLNLHGNYIMVGAADGGGRWMTGSLARWIKALGLSRFGSRKLVMVGAKISKEDLTILGELPEAIRYLETGHARGKVVVTL